MAEMPAITLVNLTKRELFAAIALGWLCTSEWSVDHADVTAEHAVKMADALIAELAK